MNFLERIHDAYIYRRRVHVLSGHLSPLIPKDASVLDVGCGDGQVASLIMERRPDVTLVGIDRLVRPRSRIPVTWFDGQVIPCEDTAFHVVMLVDVLHHTDEPMNLLREAVRACQSTVLVKDHILDGAFAGPTLRFLDWVGNARHGVPLPYNYWSEKRWFEAFGVLALTVTTWKKSLGLYPPAIDWIAGRSLHFIARLDLGRQQAR
jgi:SAM-dependent methyltransferase